MSDQRKAFEFAMGKGFDYETQPNAWGQPIYKHEHIESMFAGWTLALATHAGAAAELSDAEFERWLRTVCFQKPTPEAYDLAQSAYRHAAALTSAPAEPTDTEIQAMAPRPGSMFAQGWFWGYKKAIADLRAPAKTPPAAGAIDAREQGALLSDDEMSLLQRVEQDMQMFSEGHYPYDSNKMPNQKWRRATIADVERRFKSLMPRFSALTTKLMNATAHVHISAGAINARGQELRAPSTDDPIEWALFWLDSALRCTNFHWDGDQWDCAKMALTAALASRDEAPAAAGAALAVASHALDEVAIRLIERTNTATWLAFRRAVAALAATPAPEPLKDHQIAKLVNDLRDVAEEYGQTQQLRERIAGIVVPALKAAQPIEREDGK